MLIILRVIRGRALPADTVPELVSTAEFATGTRSSASEVTGMRAIDNIVSQRSKIENASSNFTVDVV
jgi:hypothetical protein